MQNLNKYTFLWHTVSCNRVASIEMNDQIILDTVYSINLFFTKYVCANALFHTLKTAFSLQKQFKFFTTSEILG